MELLRYDAAQCEVFEELQLLRDMQHVASATWIELEILVLHTRSRLELFQSASPSVVDKYYDIWFVWMHNLIRDVVV